MIYNFNVLHFWNREKICYKFHVYSFHFWWEMSKLQLVWLEVEDEVIRARFVLHIYWFAYVNRCIATLVVEARACNLWDLGSSPNGTLLIFSHFAFLIFVFLASAGPLWAWLVFFIFLLANPLQAVCTPGPSLFIFLFIFIHFIFILLNIFPNIKKSQKIDFYFNLVYFIFLTKKYFI